VGVVKTGVACKPRLSCHHTPSGSNHCWTYRATVCFSRWRRAAGLMISLSFANVASDSAAFFAKEDHMISRAVSVGGTLGCTEHRVHQHDSKRIHTLQVSKEQDVCRIVLGVTDQYDQPSRHTHDTACLELSGVAYISCCACLDRVCESAA